MKKALHHFWCKSKSVLTHSFILSLLQKHVSCALTNWSYLDLFFLVTPTKSVVKDFTKRFVFLEFSPTKKKTCIISTNQIGSISYYKWAWKKRMQCIKEGSLFFLKKKRCLFGIYHFKKKNRPLPKVPDPVLCICFLRQQKRKHYILKWEIQKRNIHT
jgi:hypothetical protein